MCIHEQYFKLWGLKHHLNFLWLLQPSHWDGQSIMQDTSICSQVWLPLAMLFTRNRFQTCNMHIKLLLSFVYSMLFSYLSHSIQLLQLKKMFCQLPFRYLYFLLWAKNIVSVFFFSLFFKKKIQVFWRFHIRKYCCSEMKYFHTTTTVLTFKFSGCMHIFLF